jgi:hypothetical protein
MSLIELREVVEPPLAPLERGTPEEWIAAERSLGTSLPDDYKALIDAYGTGSFNDFIYVLNPFAANENLNMVQRRKPLLDAYRTMKRSTPEQLPDPAYPEPGGLLPWAVTDNGNVFYWHTAGDPSAWQLVIFDGDHVEHERYELSTTTFLAQLLSGEIQSELLPEDLLEDDAQYFELRA